MNAVASVAIATEMIDRVALEEGTVGRQKLALFHTLGRLGHVNEMSGAVLYLASDAASFTTGVSLAGDGCFSNLTMLFDFSLRRVCRGVLMLQIVKAPSGPQTGCGFLLTHYMY